MCGKFTQMYAWQHVHAFSPPLVATDGGELITATPMCFAKVMRLDCAGARELIPMRWGFAGKDDAAPTRPKHMHARCETIDGKPTFAQAFAHARGILMVHTFNEGEELPSGKTKQWVIAPRDGQPIAIAVICEQWNNGTERFRPSFRSRRLRTLSSPELRIACPRSCHATLGRRGWVKRLFR